MRLHFRRASAGFWETLWVCMRFCESSRSEHAYLALRGWLVGIAGLPGRVFCFGSLEQGALPGPQPASACPGSADRCHSEGRPLLSSSISPPLHRTGHEISEQKRSTVGSHPTFRFGTLGFLRGSAVQPGAIVWLAMQNAIVDNKPKGILRRAFQTELSWYSKS
jgi:hypothetical protein